MPDRSITETFHRAALWTMIVALAICGLFGAAILLAGVADDTAWRAEIALFAFALHAAFSLYVLRSVSGRALTTSAILLLAMWWINFAVLQISIWITGAQEKAWMQTGVLAGSTALLLPAGILLRKRRLFPLAVLNIVCVIAASATSLFEVWTNIWIQRTTLEKVIASLWAGSFTITFLAGLYGFHSVDRLRWLRIATAVMLCIGGGLVIASIIDDQFWEAELCRRITFGCATLAGFGVLVHAAITRLIQPEVPRGARTAIDLNIRCPKCSEDLTLPTGSSSCPFCKTRFELRVIPSACLVCGYDLGTLPEPKCPECGAVY